MLTHVELTDEAGHVVVLEEARQNLLGKARLIEDMKAEARLNKREEKRLR